MLTYKNASFLNCGPPSKTLNFPAKKLNLRAIGLY